MAQLTEETEVLERGATLVPVPALHPVAPTAYLGRPLGEILVASEGLPQEKLDEALAQQAERGGRIGEVLVSMKLLTEEQVLRALGQQLDLPFSAKLSIDEITPELIQRLPIN